MTDLTNKEAPRWEDSEYTAQKALELVKDNYVRSILFDSRFDREPPVQQVAFSFGMNSLTQTMRKIINLAYLVALCRWKQLDETKDGEQSWGHPEDIDAFNNARFSGMFRGAVVNEEVTLDLQVFSLIELWIGLKNATHLVVNRFDNIFDDTISGDTIGLTLKQARDLIKSVDNKSSEGDGKGISLATCNEVCYRLLKSFVVFQKMKIECNLDAPLESTDDVVISYDASCDGIVKLYPNKCYPPAKFIVLYEQLARQKGELVGNNHHLTLYMLSEMATFNGVVECTYHSFDDERVVRIDTGMPKPDTQNTEDKEYIREMRKFLSFNYKDIRDIALVISDALNEVPFKKKALFDICKKKYPKIIADVQSENAPSIYWDNIVTLMLVEMGKSDFLEQILDDEALFKEIVRNIEWRQAKKKTSSYDIWKQYDAAIGEIEPRIPEDQKTVLKAQIRARIVLQCFGKEQNKKLATQCPYTESLSYKYANILSCVSVLKQCQSSNVNMSDCSEAIKKLKGIFRNIFIFLQMFYKALDAYAFAKQQQKDFDQFEPGKEKKMQDCQDRFKEKAVEVLSEIKDQTLKEAYEGFCKICEKYNSYSFSDINSSREEAKRLKSLITRSYICDVKKLRFFAETTLPKPSGILRRREDNGEPIPENYTIFDMLDLLFTEEFRSSEELPLWLGQFQDLFLFLIYNEDYNQKGLYNARDEYGKPIELKDKDCDPIYPYIVTYYKENMDRDQLKKCAYRVPIPTSGAAINGQDSGFVVTLLTDEEYQQDTYFCIPLRYGSSDSWWINPFLYPIQPVRDAYSDVFSNKSKENNQ